MEKGHRPEENQVSKTSGSCSRVKDIFGNLVSAFFLASFSLRPATHKESSLPNADGLSLRITYCLIG